MNIEIGKPYAVSAYRKKSLIEIEMYYHEDGRGLNTEIGWRNGTFIVTPQNQEEVDDLKSCIFVEGVHSWEDDNEPDIWDYESFEEIEMDSTWDGCWEEFIFYGKHFTEEEQEALEEEFENDEEQHWRNDFLEEKGFETQGCNWQIHGGIIVEEAEV